MWVLYTSYQRVALCSPKDCSCLQLCETAAVCESAGLFKSRWWAGQWCGLVIPSPGCLSELQQWLLPATAGYIYPRNTVPWSFREESNVCFTVINASVLSSCVQESSNLGRRDWRIRGCVCTCAVEENGCRSVSNSGTVSNSSERVGLTCEQENAA